MLLALIDFKNELFTFTKKFMEHNVKIFKSVNVEKSLDLYQNFGLKIGRMSIVQVILEQF